MSSPYIGEIRMFGGNFAPAGWAFCNGATIPISENDTLFNLIGTTYGGDGRVNFGLPNLQGRVPIHFGSGHTLGERSGEQGHTLSISEIPAHAHVAMGAGSPGSQPIPANALLAQDMVAAPYSLPDLNLAALNAGTIASVGGSQAHLNMQPFLVLNFSIALQGIFPSQT